MNPASRCSRLPTCLIVATRWIRACYFAVPIADAWYGPSIWEDRFLKWIICWSSTKGCFSVPPALHNGFQMQSLRSTNTLSTSVTTDLVLGPHDKSTISPKRRHHIDFILIYHLNHIPDTVPVNSPVSLPPVCPLEKSIRIPIPSVRCPGSLKTLFKQFITRFRLTENAFWINWRVSKSRWMFIWIRQIPVIALSHHLWQVKRETMPWFKEKDNIDVYWYLNSKKWNAMKYQRSWKHGKFT